MSAQSRLTAHRSIPIRDERSVERSFQGSGVKAPTLREVDVQRLVTDAAELCGWSWVHFRPAQTAHGWRTPVSGPLGAGWPDLFLARARDGRLLGVECKGAGGRVSDAQRAVHRVLRDAGLDVHVVGPDDFDRFLEVLR